MERLILSEQGYREQMENVVKPYLDIRKSVLWPEREEGKKIYCERYLADSPEGCGDDFPWVYGNCGKI